MPPLVLASASPRRRDLLALFEIPFTIQMTNIEEKPLPGEKPADLVQRLSHQKAVAVAQTVRQALVIAADTVVVWQGQILGKPANPTQARQMLRRLRHGPHQVFSGLTVLDVGSGRAVTRLNRTQVWMRPYSEAEIAAYIASGDPLDKAGAYAIQNRDFKPVAKIEGCFASVMGLPLGDLADALAEFGLKVDRVGQRCTGYTRQPCCRQT